MDLIFHLVDAARLLIEEASLGLIWVYLNLRLELMHASYTNPALAAVLEPVLTAFGFGVCRVLARAVWAVGVLDVIHAPPPPPPEPPWVPPMPPLPVPAGRLGEMA